MEEVGPVSEPFPDRGFVVRHERFAVTQACCRPEVAHEAKHCSRSLHSGPARPRLRQNPY
jgi:hypothetical protein